MAYMVSPYRVSISFNADGGRFSFEKQGIHDLQDATSLVGFIFTKIMCNWGDLDENGVTVWAEVKDGEGDCFTHFDAYELHCG